MISNEQSGLIPGYAILSIYSALDSGDEVHAFDEVWHTGLKYKIKDVKFLKIF